MTKHKVRRPCEKVKQKKSKIVIKRIRTLPKRYFAKDKTLLREKGINKEVRIVLQPIDRTSNGQESEESWSFEIDEKPDLNNISDIDSTKNPVKNESDIENVPLAIFKKKKSRIEKSPKIQDLTDDQLPTEMTYDFDDDDSNNTDWDMDMADRGVSHENLSENIKGSSEAVEKIDRKKSSRTPCPANKEHHQDITFQEKRLKTMSLSSEALHVTSSSESPCVMSQLPKEPDTKKQTGSFYNFDFNKTIVEPDDLDDFVKM